jgi:hypothetical protein
VGTKSRSAELTDGSANPFGTNAYGESYFQNDETTTASSNLRNFGIQDFEAGAFES